MKDVLLSSARLLDRLGREEQQLKSLGLHIQAAGVRVAIVALIKETEAAKSEPQEQFPQPLEPST